MPSILSLPANETRCHTTSNAKDDCSPFWKAVLANRQTLFRLSGYSVWSLAAIHAFALLVTVLVLTAEACIGWRPWWMRCQCWWGWYRRMCSLLRCATRAEIESLDEHVWDGMRLWSYGSLCLCVSAGSCEVVVDEEEWVDGAADAAAGG